MRRFAPAQLATDLQPLSQDELAGCVVRAIALVEQERDGQPSMLTLRELAAGAAAERARRSS